MRSTLTFPSDASHKSFLLVGISIDLTIEDFFYDEFLANSFSPMKSLLAGSFCIPYPLSFITFTCNTSITGGVDHCHKVG